MLIGSNLPAYLWEELWRTAIWIYNRTPHSFNSGRSPLMTLSTSCDKRDDSQADLELLHVPGCCAVVHVPTDERAHKLAPAGLKVIYLGPARASKAFRFWDPIKNVVIERRDAEFQEDTTYDPTAFGLDSTRPNTAGCLDDDDRYELAKIVDHRVDEDENLEFRIRWKGYSAADDTWEPLGNLDGCEHEVQRYCVRHRLPMPAVATGAWPDAWVGAAAGAVEPGYAFSPDPRTYEEAMAMPDSDRWNAACALEHGNLLRMDVYVLVPRPQNVNIVSTKWVFKKKLRADHTIERYRARWVGRGFTQRPGDDYDETYAPVASYTFVRLTIGLAAHYGWDIEQTDVPAAYLRAPIDKPLYATQPPGFEDTTHPDYVCLFNKCLPGFKQSAHRWNDTISTFLRSLGFVPSSADACAFILRRLQETVDKEGASSPDLPECILILYVDDITITGSNTAVLTEVKQAISDRFETRWSPAEFFLRNRILRHRDGSISIDQQHHVEAALRRFGMIDANPVWTPLDANTRLKKRNLDEGQGDVTTYQELVGTLLYIAGCTRPDISFAVSRLSRHLADPSTTHMAHAKRLLRYLKATRTHGILFQRGDNITIPVFDAYVDSDHASDTDDRKSQTGYVFLLANGPILARSGKQKCVTLSTTEAEYVAASEAARDLSWIRRAFIELGMVTDQALRLFIDNSGAQALATGAVGSGRTKHIDVRAHYVCEAVENGLIELNRVESADNTADLLTKALPRPAFERLRSAMGVLDISRLEGGRQ